MSYRLIPLFLVSQLCSCASPNLPPRKMKLPAELSEASGLVINRDSNIFYLHNDSGDGPNLYAFNPEASQTTTTALPAAAADWESLARDENGHFYIADTGNNRGLRQEQTIYRYAPLTGQVDTINFTYPDQDGGGRLSIGNYDCEALIHSPEDGKLHLFTKALPGRRKAYWAYHFSLPDAAGTYVAELIDSLYLPRRVITGAALDKERNELALVTYNYQRILGIIPFVSSSLIVIRDYPASQYFRGRAERRNLSWAKPVQYEAIDFYNEEFIYIATERTILRRQGLRRIRR
ncbi:hypothetical protein CEQ90_03125 [Lewinellaceae bacterium SD302]|nr:hypothetical protein CEQ90_03125 [Lewinellaceae bacterium SD302]